MTNYTFEKPEGGPELFTSFCTNLSSYLKTISGQINTLEKNISKKLDDVTKTLQAEIRSADNKAIQALDLALSHDSDIKCMKKELFELKRKCNGLECENKRLLIHSDNQETYSRRENLLIHWNKVNANETEEMCVTAVRNFLATELKLSVDAINRIIFVRCHRIGKRDNPQSSKFSRPIIVRFLEYNDRKAVWSKRFDIQDKSCSISENFANNIEYRRRLLYPIAKKAKQLSHYNKVYLRGDKIVVDDIVYSFDDNLHALPADLHPRQFSYRSTDEWILFGGPHSVFNFLSNYFPHQITVKDITYDTLEQAYQHAKAEKFRDAATAEKILCAKTPAIAKQLGSHVKNFVRADWDCIKGDVLLELLRIKFEDGTDLGNQLKLTTGKSLAEAGRSRSFATGLTLNHHHALDRTKWATNGNLLGRSLMTVRDKLNS